MSDAGEGEPAGLGRLFAPRSVALVGVPGDLSRPGARPLHFLLRHGYPGRVYPVNPGRRTIGDLPAYPALDALPERPDVAWIGLPAAQAVRAIEACGRGRHPVRGGAGRRVRGDRRGRRGGAGAPGRDRARGRRSAPRAEHGRVRQRVGPGRAHVLDHRQARDTRAGPGGRALAVGRAGRMPARSRDRAEPRRGPVRFHRQRGGPLARRLPRLARRGRPGARDRVPHRAGPRARARAGRGPAGGGPRHRRRRAQARRVPDRHRGPRAPTPGPWRARATRGAPGRGRRVFSR